MTFIAELIANFILTEVHVCLPALARWIVRWRSAKLPADLRERMQEEWLAEVEACPSHLLKLYFACGLFSRAGDLVQAHDDHPLRETAPEKPGVTGNLTVTLTGVSATASAGTVTPVAPGQASLASAEVVIRASDTIVAQIVEAVGTARGSSAAEVVPLTWQNSGVFDAANVVIRNSYARRAAHTHAAASAMISSSAVLFPPEVDR